MGQIPFKTIFVYIDFYRQPNLIIAFRHCDDVGTLHIYLFFYRYYPFFFFGNIGVSLLIMALIAIHRLFGVFYGHLLDRVFNQV